MTLPPNSVPSVLASLGIANSDISETESRTGLPAKGSIISIPTYNGCMSARADVLKTILTQDPKNTFARYGLAMEHVNLGELSEAVVEFETILGNDPNYGAAYYHGGQALTKLGRLEDAVAM